ncbi:protein FAR1-RELATED SEQUENCE 5 [Artemisia annua]|uniref:Protein FAR1-RELATED SEQUENCE 5 n=1 Tax=Artemisia annua TaxID=35608 RepID=A0A2U1P4W2_ARTAN|nr:protein FAR1-RELATED SEQUENCE 5 [Artemisia annua]
MDKGKYTGKDVEEEPVNLFSRPDGLYKVLRNIEDGSVVCSCQLFVRVRILCRHIFCVFKNAGIENEIVENYASEATSIVDYCVHMLSKDEPRLSAFVEKLKLLKIDVEADCPNPPSKEKLDNLKELVGVPKPAEKTVNNPSLGNLKGRKKLRIKGGKEQALEKNKKNKNAGSLCGETDGHNRRTCPKKYAVEDELDQTEVTREEDNLDQSEVIA